MGRSLALALVVRESRRVVPEKLAIRVIVSAGGKTGLAAQPHALRRGRNLLVRGHDERVAPLVGEVIIECERGVVARVHPTPEVREPDPAHLDETEEALAAEQTVVLARVAQVPVEGDEVRHGVEHLGRLERNGRRLEGKVAHFDPRHEEAVHLLFGRVFHVADVVGDFGWHGRGGLGTVGGGTGRLGTRGEGEDGSGMSVKVLSMRSGNNLGLFEGEASVGLTRGDAGENLEKSVVFDDISTAGLTDDGSRLRWRFPTHEEPLTEREGAKGGEKTAVLTADVVSSDISVFVVVKTICVQRATRWHDGQSVVVAKAIGLLLLDADNSRGDGR
jgi:hypothetical protein